MSAVTRLGIYGGSFDPIHKGHVKPVIRAADQLDLDRVIYLPTAHPPHKAGRSFAPALRRLAMVELAVLDDPRLHVSDFELGEDTSYTIDTIEHFAEREPNAALYLALGSDSLAQIETWRRWQDILERAHLAVLRRPGSTREQAMGALSPATRKRLTADRITFIDNVRVDVSATEIRRRLAAGEGVPSQWVSPAVVQYAQKYCLYS